MENTIGHEILADLYQRTWKDITLYLNDLEQGNIDLPVKYDDKGKIVYDDKGKIVLKTPWFDTFYQEWTFLHENKEWEILNYFNKNVTERFEIVCRELALLLPETDAVKAFLPILLSGYFISYRPYEPHSEGGNKKTKQETDAKNEGNKPQTDAKDEKDKKVKKGERYNLLVKRFCELETKPFDSKYDEEKRNQLYMKKCLELPDILTQFPKLTADSFSDRNISRVLPIYLQTIQFLKFLKETRTICAYRCCLLVYEKKTGCLSLLGRQFADIIDFLDRQDDAYLLSPRRQAHDQIIDKAIDSALDDFNAFIPWDAPNKVKEPDETPQKDAPEGSEAPDESPQEDAPKKTKEKKTRPQTEAQKRLKNPEYFPMSFLSFLDELNAFLKANDRAGERKKEDYRSKYLGYGASDSLNEVDEADESDETDEADESDETDEADEADEIDEMDAKDILYAKTEHQLKLTMAYADTCEEGLDQSDSIAFVKRFIEHLEEYENGYNVSQVVYQAIEDCLKKNALDIDIGSLEFEEAYLNRMIDYDIEKIGMEEDDEKR